MATSWQIGVIEPSGDIISTRVHYDGMPMQVKRVIKDLVYDQVTDLLDGGKKGYSSLYKPYDDDSRNAWVEGNIEDLAAYMTKVKQSWSMYVYLFDARSDDEAQHQWLFAKTGQRELMPLFHQGYKAESVSMSFKEFHASKLLIENQEDELIDKLAADITLNWSELDEHEIYELLKKDPLDYLKGLSDEDLDAIVHQAYYQAMNN